MIGRQECRVDDKVIAGAGMQAAKQRFDSGKGKRKISYSFEERLDLFKTDTISFSEIARRAGVKQQAIQQLYYRYFKDLFSGRNGLDRISASTPKRRAAKIEQAKQSFDRVPILKLVARQAQAAGCLVEAVPVVTTPGIIYRERLRINGHLCSVHRLTKKQKPSPENDGWFVRMSVSSSTLAEVAFVVVRTAIKGFPVHTFVVPVSTIVKAHKRSDTRLTANFWLPTKKLPIRGNRLDWWTHENAWHLLSPSFP
jgi:predicted DNA-binding protein YlxM (UPF0122 family)